MNVQFVINSLSPFHYVGLAIGTTLGIHYGFYKFTDSRKTIIPKEKYIKVGDGSSRFMIVDENNEHYQVSKLLWKFKFDNAEEYSKIETGKDISVHYYGLRYPFLRMYPKIYMVCQDVDDCVYVTEKKM